MLQVKLIKGQRNMLEGSLNKTLRRFPQCLIENGYPADAKFKIVDIRLSYSMSGGNDLAYIIYNVEGPHDEDGEPPYDSNQDL